MEQTDKSIEQLEDEAKKASEALQTAAEKLESAKKELESKPDDEKLKKKVDGLEKAMQTAKTKVVETAKAVEDTKKALKDAQDENAKKETPKDGGDNPKSADGGGSGEKKIRLRVRSKTGKPSYFRAGLRFTPVDAEYEVSEDVAEILKNDPWLDGKTAGGRERSLEYTTKFPPARDFAIAKLAVKELLQNKIAATNQIPQRVWLVQTRADCKNRIHWKYRLCSPQRNCKGGRRQIHCRLPMTAILTPSA